ncbi:restriction endonuclease subunit S, partial [Ruminococcus sp.]|uniref:restriction endonuclease subunit S n=1 Tax=Ruminococcus sp. TaxID=41978 RepID=UPI0025825D83
MREMKDSGIEWIGTIPKEWSIIRLCYLIGGYKAGPFGSALIMDKLADEGDILVYTPEIIAENRTDLPNNKYLQEERLKEMEQFVVQKDDIIFPIVGSLGRAMLITEDMPIGIINQRLSKFHLTSDVLFTDYFLWLFARSSFYAPFIDVSCRGSIIVNLTKAILHDMPVIIPTIKEQKTISKYLDSKCEEIDSVISDIQSQIEALEEYKRSVITEAVTKGLDPDVEMRDSGVQWIGMMPTHWDCQRG